MHHAESIRRQSSRIYYYQSGLAAEVNGRISVHITAMVVQPKLMFRSMRLHIPAEQYCRFLDVLQAQTSARFTHGKNEYDRQTKLLRGMIQAGM